jgi:enoyl-CoA hydratase/carnithine racemase
MAARLLTDRQGPTLLMTLSNPEARNALHPDIYAAGLEAVLAAGQDPSLRVLVLTGEGPTFCAGGNLNRLRENRGRPKDAQRASIDAMHAWVRSLRECPKPVIAAVEGAAAGAGFSLVLACDLVVAAEDAKFSMAYVKIGLSPDGGATHGLSQRLPYPLAFELAATGAPLDAARLAALGLVNRVVPRGQAAEAALRWAEQLAAGPSRVLGRIKALIARRERKRLGAHLDAEREAFVESLYEDDAAEGIDAFLSRRPPAFNRNTEQK